jgi:hypothetical protein
VPTPGAITGLLAAFPDETQLIPDPAAPDADVAPVRLRKLTLIPPHLFGQILGATMAPGGLSPRQLWKNIAGPLAADDQVAPQVSPFLHWCRLAFAQGQGADNPLQLAIPPSLVLDAPLQQTRVAILHQDLPRRFTLQPPTVAPGFGTVVDALGASVRTLSDKPPKPRSVRNSAASLIHSSKNVGARPCRRSSIYAWSTTNLNSLPCD